MSGRIDDAATSESLIVMKTTITGYTREGKLHVSPSQRHVLTDSVLTWPDGPASITVERPHATRSAQANAYYWAVVVAALSDYTGSTPDEMHAVLKTMFLPKDVAIADRNGEIIGEFVIGGSTTQLTTLQFYDYVETIRSWAFEKLDVSIAPPDPEWRERAEEERRAKENQVADEDAQDDLRHVG